MLEFTTTRPPELCLAVTKAISEELIDDCIFSFLTTAHTIITSELSALFNFKRANCTPVITSNATQLINPHRVADFLHIVLRRVAVSTANCEPDMRAVGLCDVTSSPTQAFTLNTAAGPIQFRPGKAKNIMFGLIW